MIKSSRIKALILLSMLLETTEGLAEQQYCLESSSQSSSQPRFSALENGEVLDKQTGLVWQQCLLGASGEMCKRGKSKKLNWKQALEAARISNEATQSQWRLPNVRELASLVALECNRPAINLFVFADDPGQHVWSSSPYKFYPHYAWYVDFSDGSIVYSDRQDAKHVRLVRDAN